MSPDFTRFESETGITFKDKKILREAFTHRSYLNESKEKGLLHNERLEFLGDAVLELVSTDFLFKKYPNEPEGTLTAYRAGLVNANILSGIALDLHLGEMLLLSKGEAKDIGKARQYILANTIESVIGAIYLDQGYDVAADFIAKHILIHTEEVVGKGLWQDAKSLFQEKAQEQYGITPSYKVLEETGPDHDKQFKIGVYLGEKLMGDGIGRSKQDAEQMAAKNVLENHEWKTGRK
ncbi:MAG: ribonuclease III [Candidatus Paceibacterota bacterium]|jgi:ribonuclease-3|nr:ribonuclease III [Candidatus Paceibacterota bacterium]